MDSQTELKVCSKCKKQLSKDNFRALKHVLKNSVEKYFLASWCNKCVCEYSSEHQKQFHKRRNIPAIERALSPEQLIVVKKLLFEGVKKKDIAKEYNLSESDLSNYYYKLKREMVE